MEYPPENQCRIFTEAQLRLAQSAIERLTVAHRIQGGALAAHDLAAALRMYARISEAIGDYARAMGGA